jgi:hypothetical protein
MGAVQMPFDQKKGGMARACYGALGARAIGGREAFAVGGGSQSARPNAASRMIEQIIREKRTAAPWMTDAGGGRSSLKSLARAASAPSVVHEITSSPTAKALIRSDITCCPFSSPRPAVFLVVRSVVKFHRTRIARGVPMASLLAGRRGDRE